MAAGYPAPCAWQWGRGVALAWLAVGVIVMESPKRVAMNCRPVEWESVMPEWTWASEEDCCARKWCLAKDWSSTMAKRWLLSLGELEELLSKYMALGISLVWARWEVVAGRVIGAARVVMSSGYGATWLAKLVTGKTRWVGAVE